MAETTKTEKTPAPAGDHDRVQMLSVAKDGSLDQHNPEIIGDKEAALAATKEQFRTQAVAAVDAVKRPELGLGGGEIEVVEDKSIGELKKAQDAAAKTAESAAEKAVNALHDGK